MTAVRWIVEHPTSGDLGPDWIEYPDEAAARTHAGTAGTVWALVPPGVVKAIGPVEADTLDPMTLALAAEVERLRPVYDAAVAWRDPQARRRLGAATADLMRAVDTATRLGRLATQEPTR